MTKDQKFILFLVGLTAVITFVFTLAHSNDIFVLKREILILQEAMSE